MMSTCAANDVRRRRVRARHLVRYADPEWESDMESERLPPTSDMTTQ